MKTRPLHSAPPAEHVNAARRAVFLRKKPNDQIEGEELVALVSETSGIAITKKEARWLIHALIQEGMMTPRHRESSSVARDDVHAMLRQQDLRCAEEAFLMGQIAEYANVAEIRSFEDLVQKTHAEIADFSTRDQGANVMPADQYEVLMSDRAFHKTLSVNIAGYPEAEIPLIQRYSSLLLRSMVDKRMKVAWVLEALHEHRNLLVLLQTGDAQAAMAAMQHHFAKTNERTLHIEEFMRSARPLRESKTPAE